MLRRIEAEGQPLVVYLHPWEMDPAQPRMQGPVLSRFRHYLNLKKTEGRLTALLNDFVFGPLGAMVPALQSGAMSNRSSNTCFQSAQV
jgi:hypothetical protein